MELTNSIQFITQAVRTRAGGWRVLNMAILCPGSGIVSLYLEVDGFVRMLLLLA